MIAVFCADFLEFWKHVYWVIDRLVVQLIVSLWSRLWSILKETICVGLGDAFDELHDKDI